MVRGIFFLVVLALAQCAESQSTQPSVPDKESGKAPAQSLTADQMLGQMLKPAPTTQKSLQPASEKPVIDKSSGKGAVKPNAPSVLVLREGTFLADRVGRLTRSSDGSYAEFAFDSDGKAMKDPPLIILPNVKLMLMEDAVTGNSRDLKFRISGMVTEYRGRNYVLLEKVVVVPDATQQF